MSNMYVVVRV